MATCSHVAVARLQPPRPSQAVFREECTQCFDSQDSDTGIDVCLSCFNAGCVNDDRKHAISHFDKSQHPLVLNVKRIPKPKSIPREDEPPTKISKLAIQPENDEDLYEIHTFVKCYACGGVEIDRTQGNLPAVVDGILTAIPFSRRSEVQAWEEEIISCKHTEELEQVSPFKLESESLAHCAKCELKNNLWLCLTCGSLGCGRKQFGDVQGGNGHGLEHTNETNHPLAVKLGTITPEGTADIYCYACNDARLDPHLARHLRNFGINVSLQQKTEKSMTELQIEQNQKFDFSMTTAEGKNLEPLFGAGFTGMKNLGNSCYLASVMQSTFSLKPFVDRYYPSALEHTTQCQQEPSTCLQCQISKIADGLLSGRYSQPVQSDRLESGNSMQSGIAPSMFKSLVGKGHPEFSTMRQQDAFEFYQYLIKLIEQNDHINSSKNPAQYLKFNMEQRLQCSECKRVRYRSDVQSNLSIAVSKKIIKEASGDVKAEYAPTLLTECLRLSMADETVSDYNCPHCKKKTNAIKTTRFETFPDVLVVHTRRFEMINWVPEKLEIPIIVDEVTSLSEFKAHGLQEGEEMLPDEEQLTSAPVIDLEAVSQLESMGFSRNQCEKALVKTGNNGVEVAMNWLLEHMEDDDIETDAVAQTRSGNIGGNSGEPSPELVSMLMDMGFNDGQSRKALRETGGNMERAVEWLFSHPEVTGDEDTGGDNTVTNVTAKQVFGSAEIPANYVLKSFISHKGSSVHAGHYVAHVRKNGMWVLYNDEKVVKAEDVGELQSTAYIYLFERV